MSAAGPETSSSGSSRPTPGPGPSSLSPNLLPPGGASGPHHQRRPSPSFATAPLPRHAKPSFPSGAPASYSAASGFAPGDAAGPEERRSRSRTRGGDRSSASPPRPPSPMPRRPGANAPFHPGADTSTYRDLLLFEERLKMNAEMLRRRRQRYRIFLWSFIIALALTAYCLLTRPPENIILLRGLQVALAVVAITLTLFFASGMYEEKIRYAHSYINHSNKALRPLNMYLNVRRPPTTWYSLLSLLPLPASMKPGSGLAAAVPPKRPGGGVRRVSHGQQVMAQIPPSSNPRGELIFASRVDPHFEEGYKRYRAAFERRREERAREEAKARGPWYVGWLRRRRPSIPVRATPTPPASRRGTPDPSADTGSGMHTKVPSPAASPAGGPRRRRGHGHVTPSPSPPPEGRERAESYSFVYTGPGEAVGAKAR